MGVTCGVEGDRFSLLVKYGRPGRTPSGVGCGLRTIEGLTGMYVCVCVCVCVCVYLCVELRDDRKMHDKYSGAT